MRCLGIKQEGGGRAGRQRDGITPQSGTLRVSQDNNSVVCIRFPALKKEAPTSCMPSVTKTVSIFTCEHLQDVLNTRCGFMSVQHEFEKTLKLIRPPVHLKVTDVFCS